ncbi:MAG: hypothetical protein DKINENOH_04831 [bacterium]|nr:hypothetical protein [bacterium]
MLLLNFSHPLTEVQIQQVEALIGKKLEEVQNFKVQFEAAAPYAAQVEALVEGIGLGSAEWQNRALLINPPAFSFIAVALLAELHGRMGYFPPCLRLRPVAGSVPPQYEVAEVLDLREIRERARARRA